MKKLISLLLALMMVLSLATTAFALEDETNGAVNTSGSITITGANSEYTYSIYKLLHLDTYDNTNGAYTYKVESKWATFFTTPEALEYVTIDSVNGYVSWVTGKSAADFAKLALKYAQDNGITPEIAQNSGNFTGLTLGYYLVDTSMGALCGLSTTKPEAHISVKNGVPTVGKSVEEDSHVGTGTNPWGDSNTANIGQNVNFDVTIEAQAGAEKYIYHDDMDASLELDPTTVVVKHHNPSIGTTTTLVKDTHYTLVINPATCSLEGVGSDWNCTFEVVFNQTFLDSLAKNDKIYINYTAKLTDQAVIGGSGNKNGAGVTYGDNHKTEFDYTTTYTYGFEIFKTDADLKPLTGAEFELLDYNKTPMKVYYNTTTKEYRVGTKALTGEEERSVITVENATGLARVKGLDNGTYYLRETKAPLGFTLLTDLIEFTISGSNLYADNTDGVISVGASVHVENNKGLTLPETGATGTTMFIFFGMFVMLSTGVLLVTKKRMSMIEE